MDALEEVAGLRAVVVKGRGRHFQAGADLNWINTLRTSSSEENVRASRATAEAVRRLNRAQVPTVALVQGACFGGGTGLVAACDIVIAADDAIFSIAEVRWGLSAAIIIPQLNDAIGVRQVRRYALTGERFGAEEARRIGIVHQVVALTELEAAGARIVDQLLQNGPEALSETKMLALQSAWSDLDEAKFDRLIEIHAGRRQSAEAAEGLLSFVEKRAAQWK
jgi:methylglutaconyl-CoA hydratase